MNADKNNFFEKKSKKKTREIANATLRNIRDVKTLDCLNAFLLKLKRMSYLIISNMYIYTKVNTILSQTGELREE